MSRIPTNVGQVKPQTTGQTTTSQDVGELGGHTVRAGSGGKHIKRSIANIFSKISSKFKALGQRIATSQAKAKLKRQTKDANRSAGKLAKTIARGKSTHDVTSAMISLVHKARKLDPNNPAGKASELLRSAVGDLSETDQANFVQKRDWDAIATAMKADVDHRCMKDQVLLEALSGVHGITAPDPSETQQAADEMKAAIDTIVGDIKAEGFNARRAALQAKLPQGVTIDDQGFLRGSHTLHTTPSDTNNLQVEQRGVGMDEAVSHVVNLGLNGTQTRVDPIGIAVPNQCTKDMYRFDMHIDTPGGTYHSRQDTETDPKKRNNTALTNLRQLTGDDTATRVLASTLKQSCLRAFHEAFQTPDGKAVNMKFATKGNYPDATIKTSQGIEDIDDLAQYGSAVWNVTADANGNYKVSIDWTMYAVGMGGGPGEVENPLPVHDETGVVRSDFHIEYVVDAAAARRGELQLSMPNPPTVDFSGGLTNV